MAMSECNPKGRASMAKLINWQKAKGLWHVWGAESLFERRNDYIKKEIKGSKWVGLLSLHTRPRPNNGRKESMTDDHTYDVRGGVSWNSAESSLADSTLVHWHFFSQLASGWIIHLSSNCIQLFKSEIISINKVTFCLFQMRYIFNFLSTWF